MDDLSDPLWDGNGTPPSLPLPFACARLQKKITSPDICPQKNTDNTLLLLFSPSSRPRFSSSSRDLGCAH